MYADYSREQVQAFLQDLTDQPKSMELDNVAESFSDEMILAEMELARFKTAASEGRVFETRSDTLMKARRIHPADLQ